MGVHAPGGPEHGPLSRRARLAQAAEGLLGRKISCFHPQSHRFFKIRQQGGGAVQEGKHVHIPVAAVIAAVHQTGLWGGAHLIEQRLGRQSTQSLLVFFCKIVLQDGLGGALELLHGVEAAGGAPLALLAAHQALPGRLSQLGAVPLAAHRIQNIQVKEAAQGIPVLQLHAQLLHRPAVSPYHPQGLTSGRFIHFFPMDNIQPPGQQGALQPLQPLPEGPAEDRGVFHRPGNVQAKGDNRKLIFLQQLLLAHGPGLPGTQHLHEGDGMFH